MTAGGVLFFIKFEFGTPDTNALAQLFLELQVLCASSYCMCILSIDLPASRR